MPTDNLNRIILYNAVATPDGGSAPTNDQNSGLNPTQIISNYDRRTSVLQFNVKFSDIAATGSIQIWVYDSFIGWCKTELITFPPSGGDSTYGYSLKSDVAGQTIGITVPTLSAGTITITATLLSSALGGNFV